MLVINESRLYSLILSSKLPAAKDFKRWVTSEILPSIRATGEYRKEVSNDAENTEQILKILLDKIPHLVSETIKATLNAINYDREISHALNQLERKPIDEVITKPADRRKISVGTLDSLTIEQLIKRKRNFKIGTLPADEQIFIEKMILGEETTLQFISDTLKGMGYKVSTMAIYRYGRLLWKIEMLKAGKS